MNKKGIIYLIGAGPGDPGLLTIKAMECIKNADVIVYDYLAASYLLKYAKDNAEIIYVGKKGGHHTLAQDKINSLLVTKGLQGLNVVRLKGGDPFVFGRGGEEAEILCSKKIPFEIVPGVTSAIAAPAYAGIPVTHRKYTSSISIVTGHEDILKQKTNIQWDLLARGKNTLVFLMGVKNLSNIIDNLIKNGKSANTPIALIRWGTTLKQKTITGTLENIVEKTRQAQIKPPAVIIIGEVVSLRNKMKWFESRPLFGKKIIVTRARNQASDLVIKLENLGGQCIEIPTIKIIPPKDETLLKQAINKIHSFDWVVFTSINGVKFFFKTLFAEKMDVRVLGHLKFACIGPATKAKLMSFGIISDILPKTYKAESVIHAFSKIKIKNKKILIPRAKKARPILPEELKKMGGDVLEVPAYETEIVHENKKYLIDFLEENKIDIVTFTSSSTVKNFKALIPHNKFQKFISNITSACIGPITAQTAIENGIKPKIIAESYTISGLVKSILDYYGNSV